MNTTSTIVYNLSAHSCFSAVPSAFVCVKNTEIEDLMVSSRLFSNTVKSYGFELSESQKRLFEIIDELSDEALFPLFKLKNKAKTLEQLFNLSPEIKLSITNYVEKRMDEFLDIIAKNDFILCKNLRRQLFVNENKVVIACDELNITPNFKFWKVADGVRYTLSLDLNGKNLIISQSNVQIICNTPAWVIINNVLYNLEELNGNLLKPFITKDEVLIPQKLSVDYFKKFIVRITEKANIEADGFDIVTKSQLLGCELKIEESLFNNTLQILPVFQYQDGHSFRHKEKSQIKSNIHFDDDNIKIIKQLRLPEQEAVFIKKLHKLNIRFNEFGDLIPLKNINTKFEMFEQLIELKGKLEAENIKIHEPILLNSLQMLLGLPTYQVNIEKEDETFVFSGEISCLDERIPFYALAKNMREEQPVLTLGNGKGLLIPKSWFAFFKTLFDFGKTNKENIVLSLSQMYAIREQLPQDLKDQLNNLGTANEVTPFKLPEALKATLFPYQLEGVKWMANLQDQHLGGCLADDMGLGKTLQTITTLLITKEKKQPKTSPEEATATTAAATAPPLQLDAFQKYQDDMLSKPLQALIVLPASLLFNWKREIEKFAPSLTVLVHTGIKRHKNHQFLMVYDIVLTTYSIVQRDNDLLNNIQWEYIILDESQQIKNKDSQTFKSLLDLRAKNKLSLSGTPVENTLADLWSQMQFINPDLLGRFEAFKKNFIIPIEKKGEKSKIELLRQMVGPYLLRRTIQTVAKDLPELTQQVVYTEMSELQKKIYIREKNSFKNYLRANSNKSDKQYTINIQTALLRLRQIANHPLLHPDFEDFGFDQSEKFNLICNTIKTLFLSDHKVLVFSQFVGYIRLFERWMTTENIPFLTLTGETPIDSRKNLIDKFQDEQSHRIFLISLKAGGSGLNLTAADYVLLADPWWNPQVEQQAIARSYRIGQDKPVFAQKFIVKDSIEERILKLQEVKKDLANDLLDTSGRLLLDDSDLNFLISD